MSDVRTTRSRRSTSETGARPRHSDITALTRSSLVQHTHTLTYVRQQSYTKHGHSSAPLSWYDPTQAVGASRDTRGAAAGAENLGERSPFAPKDVVAPRSDGVRVRLKSFYQRSGNPENHVACGSWLRGRARSRCKTYMKYNLSTPPAR